MGKTSIFNNLTFLDKRDILNLSTLWPVFSQEEARQSFCFNLAK